MKDKQVDNPNCIYRNPDCPICKPPTPTTPSQWKETFRKKFVSTYHVVDVMPLAVISHPPKVEADPEELIAFIHQTLQQERQLWLADLVSIAAMSFGKNHRNWKEFIKAINLINGEKE